MRNRGDCDSLSRVSTAESPDDWFVLDAYLKELDSKVEIATPPPIAGLGSPSTNGSQRNSTIEFLVRPFPIIALLLLHFFTWGTFTFVWLLSRHDNLPKFREDDPSTGKALILCLLPLYNLFWIFAVLIRLVDRANQTARGLNVRAKASKAMAVLIAVLLVVPVGMAMVGLAIWIIVAFSPDPPDNEIGLIFFQLPHILTAICFFVATPLFAWQIQGLLNRCFEKQEEILVSG